MGEIKRGAILNYILLALQIGIPLALTPYIMESLGAAEYGVYMLASTIMVRLYMSDLGRTTTTKFLSEYLGKGDKEARSAFFRQHHGIVRHHRRRDTDARAGYLPVVGGYFQQLQRGRAAHIPRAVPADLGQRSHHVSGTEFGRRGGRTAKIYGTGIIAVASAATNGLGTVLLLWLGLRSTGLILLSIGTGIMALLCNMAYCFIGLRARICLRGWSSTICKGIFIFSFWMFLNQLINMLNAGTGNYIVAMTQGPTAAGSTQTG